VESDEETTTVTTRDVFHENIRYSEKRSKAIKVHVRPGTVVTDLMWWVLENPTRLRVLGRW
jgi:hypothetical protein